MTRYLRDSGSVPLAERYDVALLDLDGVVYVGTDAVSGVPAALAAVRAAGMRLGFVTNNAARPPADVARHLEDLGIAADVGEVVTSAQAAAHYLSDRLDAGAKVLVVGTTGLEVALAERGLAPVSEMQAGVAAVVQGYSPELTWRQLAEGCVAIRQGLPWVATNLDATVPSPRGPLPGNGALVAALRHATGQEPVATGKPDPTMHREMVSRTGAARPVIIGDRLDTDIAGAVRAGCPSVLVLTGVTSVAGSLAADAGERPAYLAADVTGLLEAHPEPKMSGSRARCGRWIADVAGDRLLLQNAGESARGDADGRSEPERLGSQHDVRPLLSRGDVDAWRALCAAWWQDREAGQAPVVEGRDRLAAAALERMALT